MRMCTCVGCPQLPKTNTHLDANANAGEGCSEVEQVPRLVGCWLTANDNLQQTNMNYCDLTIATAA